MEAGLSIFEYEYMTPNELKKKVKAHNKEKRFDTYLAWLIAALPRAQNFPKFKELVPEFEEEKVERKVNKNQMEDYEIEQHLNMYKKEGRLLLIG